MEASIESRSDRRCLPAMSVEKVNGERACRWGSVPADAFDLTWTEEGDGTETVEVKLRPLGGSFLVQLPHIYSSWKNREKCLHQGPVCSVQTPKAMRQSQTVSS